MDALGNKLCHKYKNFEDYNQDEFDKILMNPENTNDKHPEVIEQDGKYFIKGNGTHRLTIEKCLGGKKAKVVVRRLNRK